MTQRPAPSFLPLALDAAATRRHALRAGAALLAVALLPAAGAAEAELAVGSALPPLSVNDQFDRPVVVDASTRLVLFAADKAAGDVATEALKAHPEVLAQQRLVYLADISGMPAVITRMFALPKLRDLPFPVGLVRDAQITAALPRKAGDADTARARPGHGAWHRVPARRRRGAHAAGPARLRPPPRTRQPRASARAPTFGFGRHAARP